MKMVIKRFLLKSLALAFVMGLASCSSDNEDVDGLTESFERKCDFYEFSKVLRKHQDNLEAKKNAGEELTSEDLKLKHSDLPEWIHEKCHKYFSESIDLSLAVLRKNDNYYLEICSIWASWGFPSHFFDEYGNEVDKYLFFTSEHSNWIISHALVNYKYSAEHCFGNEYNTNVDE